MIIGVTDRKLYPGESAYLDKIKMILHSKIDYLIVREKDLNSYEYSKLIGKIVESNYEYIDKIIVHTHTCVAKEYNITRVHLPESMLDLKRCSSINYSYSIHPKTSDIDDIVEKSSFVMVSPVFKTSCKPGAMPLDFELLKELKEKYNEKLVLLGGMTINRVEDLKKRGFKNFAFRSGLNEFVKVE